ncbi:hypothetical protein JJE00_00335 [Candidatus Bathyarchaeota archaeon]|nr:hypothetical protein [Candidatus Bathyarchaeota archaeon]
MKLIKDFMQKLGSKNSFGSENVVNKKGKLFLINKKLHENLQSNFFYAGLYLGENKLGKFSPSLNLLSILSQQIANKVVIDKKASWLFIYGKDIFRERILKVNGDTKKGVITLVLNNFEDCLGFGEIIFDLDKKPNKGEAAIKNILDLGDFLRREK